MTPDKLSELTQEQWEKVAQWREYYIKAGTQTTPADRPKAEAAVRRMYETHKLKPPPVFFWFDSPFQAYKAYSVMVKLPPEDLPRHSEHQLLSKFKGKQTADWNEFMSGVCYGPHDLYWLAHWKFCKEELGLQSEADPNDAIDVAVSAGWWWPYEEAVIMTERPCLLKLDDQGRLHSTTSAAIQYPDGWGVWEVRGVRIPQEWIEKPETLTPEVCLTWPNVEQRRVAVTLIGWEKLLAGLSNKITVDKDQDPQIGTLFQVDLPEAPNSRFLQVRCGTGRDFVLPVPQEMTTALEANAWTYSMKPSDYKKLQGRT